MNNVDLIRHLEEVVSPYHVVKHDGEVIYSSTTTKIDNDLLYNSDLRQELMDYLFELDEPMFLSNKSRYAGMLFSNGDYLLIGPIMWINAPKHSIVEGDLRKTKFQSAPKIIDLELDDAPSLKFDPHNIAFALEDESSNALATSGATLSSINSARSLRANKQTNVLNLTPDFSLQERYSAQYLTSPKSATAKLDYLPLDVYYLALQSSLETQKPYPTCAFASNLSSDPNTFTFNYTKVEVDKVLVSIASTKIRTKLNYACFVGNASYAAEGDKQSLEVVQGNTIKDSSFRYKDSAGRFSAFKETKLYQDFCFDMSSINNMDITDCLKLLKSKSQLSLSYTSYSLSFALQQSVQDKSYFQPLFCTGIGLGATASLVYATKILPSRGQNKNALYMGQTGLFSLELQAHNFIPWRFLKIPVRHDLSSSQDIFTMEEDSAEPKLSLESLARGSLLGLTRQDKTIKRSRNLSPKDTPEKGTMSERKTRLDVSAIVQNEKNLDQLLDWLALVRLGGKQKVSKKRGEYFVINACKPFEDVTGIGVGLALPINLALTWRQIEAHYSAVECLGYIYDFDTKKSKLAFAVDFTELYPFAWNIYSYEQVLRNLIKFPIEHKLLQISPPFSEDCQTVHQEQSVLESCDEDSFRQLFTSSIIAKDDAKNRLLALGYTLSPSYASDIITKMPTKKITTVVRADDVKACAKVESQVIAPQGAKVTATSKVGNDTSVEGSVSTETCANVANLSKATNATNANDASDVSYVAIVTEATNIADATHVSNTTGATKVELDTNGTSSALYEDASCPSLAKVKKQELNKEVSENLGGSSSALDSDSLAQASEHQESRGAFDEAVIAEKIKCANALLRTYFEVSRAISEDNTPIDPVALQEFLSNSVISNKRLPFHEVVLSDVPHNAYSYELNHLQAVTDGDPERALRALRSPMHGKEGRMGFTPLRHARNSAIINATLDARAAIRGGVRVEKAYTLADYMILMSELCQTEEEAFKLREECTYRFAELVQESQGRTSQKYSVIVDKILEEIERSVFIRVSREDLVKCVGRNEDYVQRVFKDEVGESLMEHLRRVRIERAKELIASSEVKVSEIADLLQFSSTSHFARVFKKFTGLSPAEFKESHYNKKNKGS